MATRARVLALAAVVALLALAAWGLAGAIVLRLRDSGGISAPSAGDIEDVIAAAIRVTREAAQ